MPSIGPAGQKSRAEFQKKLIKGQLRYVRYMIWDNLKKGRSLKRDGVF